MTKSIKVNANEIYETLLKSVSFIKKRPDLLEKAKWSGGAFIEIRETLKECFDVLDNDNTERYIGVLEWAVVQQIVDNFTTQNSWLDIEGISERFFGHPNIKLVSLRSALR